MASKLQIITAMFNDEVGKVYVYLKDEKIYENKVYIKKEKNVIKKVFDYLW